MPLATLVVPTTSQLSSCAQWSSRRALAVLLILLALAAPSVAASPVAILRIRVVEGEGRVHATGSRAARGVVVQVTDETGKPVEGARVSFLLPPDGATGGFISGLRSDIALTDGAGIALLPTVFWNKTAGPLSVRVTAVHGEVRAGITVAQFLSDSVAAAGGPRREYGEPRRRSPWLALGVIAAGAAAGGLALGMTRGGSGSVASVVQPPPAPAVVIGSPEVVVGRP